MRGHTHILKYLTTKKVVNICRVTFSYYKSRLLRRPNINGLPISMSIEPTTACNLGCTQCPSGLKQFSRRTGNLKKETIDTILNELQDSLIYLTLYFQGEPFINPRFLDIVEDANKRGIFTSTSTNAHFLDRETAIATVASGLDKLIISMDGTTQEVYEQYRVDGDLEKVKKGIKNIIEAKKQLGKSTPYVELQFIVFRHNSHQVEEIKRQSRNWGVDNLVLKTAQIYDFDNARGLLPENGKLSRYKTEGALVRIKNKLFNHCWRMWHSCVMTWDGDIVPCCFDKDGKYSMGNIKSNSFREIWQGPEYSKFRKKLFSNRKQIDICTNCSEGSKIWI